MPSCQDVWGNLLAADVAAHAPRMQCRRGHPALGSAQAVETKDCKQTNDDAASARNAAFTVASSLSFTWPIN
eukprot:521643-Amphidinium_carterae.1